MEPGGLCNARAMSLMDSPAFHRSHNSFLPAADNPPGRPSLATPAPPIRTTPKTLPCCTDRLNPPSLVFAFSGVAGAGSAPNAVGSGGSAHRQLRTNALSSVGVVAERIRGPLGFLEDHKLAASYRHAPIPYRYAG